MQLGELVRTIDWVLIGAAALLTCISLAMLVSSTYTETLISGQVIRQSAAFIGGLLAVVAIARIPYHVIARFVPAVYAITLSGLLFVFFAGQVIRGTASRLTLAGWQLQPSVFMMVALVLMLAWLLARSTHVTIRTSIITALTVLIPTAFIVLEPDIGVAALLMLIWFGLILFAGMPWRHVVLVILIGCLAAIPAWRWGLAEYQRERIAVFLNPTQDPLGAGYNVTQSIVALGSGQLAGRGLGHGPQSQLQFLPERHTDFILASVGEELGLLGVVVVLALYGTLLWRLLIVAMRTKDQFGQLVCMGVFITITVGLGVGAGMNMGLLPVTGIPLPFLSYGGSHLLTSYVLIGLVESVIVYSKWVQPAPVEISHLI